MPPIEDKEGRDKLLGSLLNDPTLTVRGYNDNQPTEPNIAGSEADAAS